jgi:hypothetical protein
MAHAWRFKFSYVYPIVRCHFIDLTDFTFAIAEQVNEGTTACTVIMSTAVSQNFGHFAISPGFESGL